MGDCYSPRIESLSSEWLRLSDALERDPENAELGAQFLDINARLRDERRAERC